MAETKPGLWLILVSDFKMNRWKLVFAFEGTDFSGWQNQPNTRTVQGEAEKAFSELYQSKIEIAGQGRTDAGVHAEYQTAHADLPDKFSSHQLIHAMKGLLPDDMALLSAKIADPEFHARFDALSRKYRYQISLKRTPLQRKFVWEINEKVNLELLNKCSEIIIGENDFINFCKPPENEIGTTICTVSRSEWIIVNELLILRIDANRFLRHMVRRLTGSMIQVATGKITLEEFSHLLYESEVKQKAFTAPPQGLILEFVKY